MTAAPAVPTSAPAEFKRIPLSAIVRNPNNPRKVFDQAELEELAASIRVHGVIEPILVRPVGKGFQLVAGERRWLASKLAEKTDISAIVEARTDAVADEIALLENVSRVGLSALEEGEGLLRLQNVHKRSIDDLVTLTGKSRTVVFGRLLLARLPGDHELRKLLLARKISASVADLVARLPTLERQTQALERLRDEVAYSDLEGETEDDLGKVSYSHAKELLEEELVLRLKSAPFDIKDPELGGSKDLKPGACLVCPKRTGAAKELFPGVKDDTCLDDKCWSRKKSVATRALKGELAEKGVPVVEAKGLFNNWSGDGLSQEAREKYAKPNEKIEGSKKTLKELLGDETPMVVAIDPDGKQTKLVDKKKAAELLKKKNPALAKKLEPPKRPAPHDWEAQNKRDQARQAAEHRLSSFVKVRAAGFITLGKALDLYLMNLQTAYNRVELLRSVGKTGADNLVKLKADEKVRVLYAMAFESIGSTRLNPILDACAKAAKLDLEALKKKAAAAVAGTCWVCGCTEDKACKGGCSWVNGEKTLCSSCAGGKGGGK